MDRNCDCNKPISNTNTAYPQKPMHPSSLPNKAKKDDVDLIIDETSVYEIDRECYERNRRARMNQRR